MSSVLTAAGIKFCMALMGVSSPNYDDCNKAMWSVGIASDHWWRSPTVNGSMPDPFVKPKDFSECVEWAKYDIYDGSKGTSYFCWRPAKYVFDMVTATFHWEFEP